jgi:hypothetical protein
MTFPSWFQKNLKPYRGSQSLHINSSWWKLTTRAFVLLPLWVAAATRGFVFISGNAAALAVAEVN